MQKQVSGKGGYGSWDRCGAHGLDWCGEEALDEGVVEHGGGHGVRHECGGALEGPGDRLGRSIVGWRECIGAWMG